MVLLIAIALSSPRVHSNMFATYVMVGLIGILALLATAIALTAYGSRRSWPMTAVPRDHCIVALDRRGHLVLASDHQRTKRCIAQFVRAQLLLQWSSILLRRWDTSTITSRD